MTTLALEIDTRQHLEMMLSLAKKLKIKSKVFENDVMTPYEKTINGDTMTLKQLTEHLDNIADNDGTMSYDEFKRKLSSVAVVCVSTDDPHESRLWRHRQR